jgi:rSAM/selenodomain-associated transferase 2
VLRDTDALARTLQVSALDGTEVIVAATAEDRESLAPLRARWPGVHWLESSRGRARQMNAGAAVATGRWLLFLHADTVLPAGWREAVDAADRDPSVSLGCFRFALDSAARAARVIEWGVRVRVALFALPYGDQALFVRRDRFRAAGGYADIPIMEDVDLVRRLRANGRLYRASLAARTSARKWERDGWVRRTLRHWRLILLYCAGVTPERLAASL